MDITEEYMDIFQNIESAVISIYREEPETTNYDVDKVYNSLMLQYKRGGVADEEPPANFSPIQANLYRRVRRMCEMRLGREEEQPFAEIIEPVEVDIMVACLRRLRKSVRHWTEMGGRQGYLEFVDEYIP